MNKKIVLGIGNRLMMDDGIGIYLTEELASNNPQSDVQYIVGESDVDFCIEQMERATFIILIDAVFSNTKPGDLTIYPLDSLNVVRHLEISPHNQHLLQALSQLKEIRRGYLIGIEPYEISFHINLSKELERKWSRILEQTKTTIEGLINTDNKNGIT